jgi:hypothetical protein
MYLGRRARFPPFQMGNCPHALRFCREFHSAWLLSTILPLADCAAAAVYVVGQLNPRRCLMDEFQDSTLSEEIDRLHAEHHRYAQRLEELLGKPYLSADEQLEEVRLKKLKLHAKDLIFALERRQPAIA